MILVFVLITTLCFSLVGRLLFKKWLNHLTAYTIIWGILIFLFELKWFPYKPLSFITWFYVLTSFFSFLVGIITVFFTRTLNNTHSPFGNSKNIDYVLFADNGSVLKYSIILMSVLSLLLAIHSWILLLEIFGSIPAIILNSSTVYRMNVQGEIKGAIPYITPISYVAVFFSAIYTAYKGKFSLITFLPFVGIIIKELATVGRAGMLLALMQFLFTFFLFRNLLKLDIRQRYPLSRNNLAVAVILLVMVLVVSASFVRITRGTSENYKGISKELKSISDNPIISPSIYFYFSSDIGVFNQYLATDGDNTKFGENTFLLFHGFLSKFDFIEKPSFFQKGYFIPIWSNTGTYLRELHADFGPVGVFIIPYFIGLITTLLWFKFYEKNSMMIFTLLVYFYLIIGFSFLVMVTRLSHWTLGLIFTTMILYLIEKIALKKSKQRLNI